MNSRAHNPRLPTHRWGFAWTQSKCDFCARVTWCRHWPQVLECQMGHFWSEDQQNGKNYVHYFYFIFQISHFDCDFFFAISILFCNFLNIHYLPLDVLIIWFKLCIFSCSRTGNAPAELQIVIYKCVQVFFAFIPNSSWEASRHKANVRLFLI